LIELDGGTVEVIDEGIVVAGMLAAVSFRG
jgi:hypothetical protein